MNNRILLWSITSALAGFLFGFDTVVISGAEQTIQALWGLSAAMHGVVMASALYGTVLGSLAGGFIAHSFGLRAPYLTGSICAGLALLLGGAKLVRYMVPAVTPAPPSMT